MPDSPHISLPLQTLMDMLESAGFELSPDLLIRAQKLLWMTAGEVWNQPQQLKSLLAPLLTRSEEEQEKFYDIFDQWIRFHVQPQEEGPAETPAVILQARRRKWWPLLILPLFLAGWGVLVFLLPEPAPQAPEAYFSLDTQCLSTDSLLRPQNVAIDSASSFLWEFGDGTIDSVNKEPAHQYASSGNFLIHLTVSKNGLDSSYFREIFVTEGPLPASLIEDLSIPPAYSFRSASENPDWFYHWNTEGQPQKDGLTFEPSFSDGEKHYVTLTVGHRQDYSGYCTVDAVEAIDLRQEIVELPSFEPLRTSQPLVSREWNQRSYWLWALLFLLGVGLFETWKAFRRRQRRQVPETTEFEEAFRTGGTEPLRVEFQDQSAGINREPISILARALRQRIHSDRKFLDVEQTLRSTIQQAGFPSFQYYSQIKPVEYLALVETQGPEDQQAQLFTEFLQILSSEQVPVDIWYFQDDLRLCFQAGSDRMVPLRRLAQMFRDHRLMIYSSGRSLLHPDQRGLLPGLPSTIGFWKEKAILTPEPIMDWGRREQILSEDFVLLPSDLDGQLELLDAWDDRNPPTFRELQRRLLRERPDESSLQLSDLSIPDEIRDFLGEKRYAWLAALALYPRPAWELTLSLAAAVRHSEEARLSPTEFDDLLKLTSMPWLRDGDLSEKLRSELIDSLSPQQEEHARECLIHLLEASSPPEGSFADQEKKIQLVIQKALLNPDDPQSQAGLELLMEEGYLDPVTRGAVRLRQQEEKSSGWSLKKQAYRVIGAILWGLAGWWIFSQPPVSNGETFGLVSGSVDSVSWYLNESAEALMIKDEGSFSSAINGLNRLAGPNAEADIQGRLWQYNHGKSQYELKNWEKAVASMDTVLHGLSNVSDNWIDTSNVTLYAGYEFRSHCMHAKGLSLYYDDQIDSALAVEEAINPSFFVTLPEPNLKSLLGVLAENQEDLSAEDQEDYLSSARKEFDLGNQSLVAGDKVAAFHHFRNVKLYAEKILEIDPDNPKASSLLDKELFKAMNNLFSNLYLAGKVVSESTPNSNRRINAIFERGKITSRLRDASFSSQDTITNLYSLSLGAEFRTSNFQGYFTVPMPQDPSMSDVDFWLETYQLVIQKDGQVLETIPFSITSILEEEPVLVLVNDGSAPQENIPEQQVVKEEDLSGLFSEISRNMVRVSGGTFPMGGDNGRGPDNATPQHEVTLGNYLISKFEVTNAQFVAFLNDEASLFSSDGIQVIRELHSPYINLQLNQHIAEEIFVVYDQENRERNVLRYVLVGDGDLPVIGVSYTGATMFCNWLINSTGINYRLPTEAEWEFAASGGNQGWRKEVARPSYTPEKKGGYTAPSESDVTWIKLYKYSGSNTASEVAYYGRSTSQDPVQQVGQLQPNQLGLYDMSGNAEEWCYDIYAPYSSSPVSNPRGGSASEENYVLRGGSGSLPVEYCETTSREQLPGEDLSSGRSTGFRLAR